MVTTKFSFRSLILRSWISGFKNPIFNSKTGFTLVEMLIVIAIISILTGILVPMVERSLGRNRLSSDVEVFRAKLEEVRLLSGSTRSEDETIGSQTAVVDEVGYYGVYLPSSDQISFNTKPYYALVRISRPLDDTSRQCPAVTVSAQVEQGSGDCLIQRINLTRGVNYTNLSDSRRIIAYSAPGAQLEEIVCSENCSQASSWQINPLGPTFNNGNSYFDLNYRDKSVSLSLEPFTAKISVQYTE